MTCSKTIPPLLFRAKLSLFSWIALEDIKYCNMEVEWGQWRRRRRRAGLATIKDLSRLINPAQHCSQLWLVSMIICELCFFHRGSEQCDKTLQWEFFYSKAYRIILWVTAVCWTARFLNFEFQIEFNFNLKSNTIRVKFDWQQQ